MLGCFVIALSVPRYAPAERSYALGPVRLGTSLLHFQRAAAHALAQEKRIGRAAGSLPESWRFNSDLLLNCF